MALRLVLLGAPGSGKGTQAEYLRQKLNMEHISTGEILRANIAGGTPTGKEAEKYMNAGELVPDELVNRMVEARLSLLDEKRGFLLDGYPRTVEQAKYLDGITNLDGALLLKVSDDEIVRRLQKRAVCSVCGGITTIEEAKCPSCGGELYRRSDDNEGTIRSRLNVYHERTEGLIEYYREREQLMEVDGNAGTPFDVWCEVIEAIWPW